MMKSVQEEKQEIRNRVWNMLEDNRISKPPKPIYGRIPNFKGAGKAAGKLRDTDEWMNSQVIFCSPDSPQIKVREYALLDGKSLIMASPRLKRGYLLVDPEKCMGNEHTASTIRGAFKFGKSLKSFPHVDLVVEGSVAVDLFGGRLGKGGGYGDKEISHLLEENVINTKTPLLGTVHELQIVDEIPLEPHDMKITMIVTPKRVIRIN